MKNEELRTWQKTILSNIFKREMLRIKPTSLVKCLAVACIVGGFMGLGAGTMTNSVTAKSVIMIVVGAATFAYWYQGVTRKNRERLVTLVHMLNTNDSFSMEAITTNSSKPGKVIELRGTTTHERVSIPLKRWKRIERAAHAQGITFLEVEKTLKAYTRQ